MLLNQNVFWTIKKLNEILLIKKFWVLKTFNNSKNRKIREFWYHVSNSIKPYGNILFMCYICQINNYYLNDFMYSKSVTISTLKVSIMFKFNQLIYWFR